MGIEGQEHLWDKEVAGHRTYKDIRIFTDEQLKNYTEEELKNFKIKHATPMLDELEKGPFPSFVSDLKREALHRNSVGQDNLLLPITVCQTLLVSVGRSYKAG